jgi:hypothetical protein
MSTLWIFAVALGALVIIVLAFFAGKLLMQLKQQKYQQQQKAIEHQIALFGHDTKVLNSINIIVRAMKEEQCDISEGCWRLCVLLGSLKTSEQLESQFPAIFELYEQIKHMSILDDRKQLTKKERMSQDFTRMKLESSLTTKIQTDLALLHQYSIERISMIKQ